MLELCTVYIICILNNVFNIIAIVLLLFIS